MTLTRAINLSLQSERGIPLKDAVTKLTALIESSPEIHREAATLIVMMMEPGLRAHREMWHLDQASDMFDAIKRLSQEPENDLARHQSTPATVIAFTPKALQDESDAPVVAVGAIDGTLLQ